MIDVLTLLEVLRHPATSSEARDRIEEQLFSWGSDLQSDRRDATRLDSAELAQIAAVAALAPGVGRLDSATTPIAALRALAIEGLVNHVAEYRVASQVRNAAANAAVRGALVRNRRAALDQQLDEFHNGKRSAEADERAALADRVANGWRSPTPTTPNGRDNDDTDD